ncbi:copper oxidase [Massilia sp. CCM 8695]|uniref:Copper oxidase n=1 Tax=Massilia frigida TaxID=2609281 RepID=A0ABX0NFP6_9BURK|nr:copper oxidase [Massilia frigida]NHZ83263.1 copper oxidase [Massilia frigida]
MGKLSKFGTIWAVGLSVACAAQAAPASCPRTVTAAVVAIDQPMMINRLGAARPGGMIYALRSDVVVKDASAGLVPGNVMLRKDKRPRPIVLRVNAGDCLTIEFDNLLVGAAHDLQPLTRAASIHVAGLQAVKGIGDDGINAGQNPNPADGGPLVAPGHRTTYHLYAPEEGSFLLYSTAGDFNGFGTDQLTMGLFGAVNVQPKNAEWYRSQVSEEDMRLATQGHAPNSKLPIINYDALYPAGHPRAGTPVLKMLDSKNRLVHSDLTAVITGPKHGRFFPPPAGAPANPALPDQGAPYREVTVHYHESQDVVQAFPWFSQTKNLSSTTLNAGADSFAINYGAAGIAAEILANRMKLGPGADCDECKFEEFFLSSWVGGDPSMVVDVPANSPCTTGQLEEYAKTLPNSLKPPCEPGKPAAARASKAYFPDDPSNVYHSYLGDRARFRILHAGAAVHHVHHHHAHQWLQSAGSDVSAYLDSQAIGPGASFTLDLVYDGSGNRNLTAGDSIFHCHFYPHFASGMWALFRVHDVFEAGTPLTDGRPTPGARALPDPEILRGTPIPAVLPLPTRPMAPWPAPVEISNGQVKLGEGGGNPGYPFFVPGRAGHRPPHPPMDFAVDGKEVLDGGLPRHLITQAKVKHEAHTTLDFSKDLGWTQAVELPEDGTPAEKAAMAAHAQKTIATFLPDGTAGRFKMNGLPPAPGAPFANPGLGVDGKVRHYRGASLQVDAVFNKKGWHYPQQRMMALWGDVKDILSGEKPPEPLFFRAHSDDVVEYWHTNLVPAYYELDDFQVRTPTDIIGQHIHLVKFDVLASDGAANGFNYEDGTFSPEEVRGRIDGINQAGGLLPYGGGKPRLLRSKAIAALGCGPRAAADARPDCGNVPPAQRQWLGAQATVQRWWVDPLLDRSGTDRTFMTVFTHDHFGPSTHQMTGLYGGLLIEPAGSTWTMLDGSPMNSAPGGPGRRADGGPTSYAANILPKGGQRAYREFALAWGDLQLAYGPGSRAQPDCYPGQVPAFFQCKPLAPGAEYRGWADTVHAINCPGCPPASPPASPKPFLISDFGPGIVSMNYRGEPLPHRVAPSPVTPITGGVETDLAHVLRSIPRSDATMSSQPVGGARIDPACTGDCLRFPRRPISAGMNPADPYTPLLRAYEDDPVQIRMLVGSHTSMHDFTMHGLKWQHAPFDPNSGFRNSQFMILSEHFEALFTVPRTAGEHGADYLYNPSASYEGLTNGAWGLLRAYRKATPDLAPLPGNLTPPPALATGLPRDLKDDCSLGLPCLRQFNVSALTVKQLLGEKGTLAYNERGINVGPNTYDSSHPLNDPNAIVYVRDEDLLDGGRLRPGAALEPLVLRAAAGDWIKVRLSNRVNGDDSVFKKKESASRPDGTTAYSAGYADIMMSTSSSVGLHPQLLAFDITSSNGANVGNNPVQTVPPRDPACSGCAVPFRDYLWYAGTLERGADGDLRATPVEFGAVNLQPADPLMQAYRGLFGAIVIEPKGATWVEDPGTRTSATVFAADGGVFRDFTLMFQNDISMELNGNPLYDAGMPLSAFNYRSEPFFYRYGVNAAAGLKAGTAPPASWYDLQATDLANMGFISYSAIDTSGAVSNALTGGDPVTPVFRAPAGMPVRFRVLHAPGIGDNQQVFELSGHQWQEQPYLDRSTRIGHNPQSAVTGATTGVGPTSHFDIVIPQAGGHFKTAGDYVYRSATAAQYQAGLWGLFRVAPGAAGAILPDTIAIDPVRPSGAGYQISGTVTVRPAAAPGERVRTSSLTLSDTNGWQARVPVDPQGRWTYSASAALPDTVLVASPFGGQARYGAAPAASSPPLTRSAATLRSSPRRRGALK